MRFIRTLLLIEVGSTRDLHKYEDYGIQSPQSGNDKTSLDGISKYEIQEDNQI